MKRDIAIILFVITALFLGGIFYFLSLKTTDPVNISVIKEEGNVYFKNSESEGYVKISTSEQIIKSGGFVRTDAASFARVFLPDNSLISIDEKSEVQISYDDNAASIDQLIGKTWHRVQTVTNGGQYEVKTANTIAAVRGTIFGVGYEEDGTSHVSVEESKVDVKSIEDGGIFEEITLEAGDRSDIPKNVKDKIKKYLTDQAFKDSAWYKRNKLIDEIFEEIKQKGVKNFRTLFQERIEKDSNFDRLSLGDRRPVPLLVRLFNNNILQQPDANQIREDLAPLYKLEKITENVCTEMPPSELTTLSDNVSKYSEYVQDSDKILNVLGTIKDGCKENTLSVDAAEKLKNLTK